MADSEPSCSPGRCWRSALGAVDGGVIGVMLKNLFADAVDASTLNFSVAFILGAPHFCNVLGFLWPYLSRGRDVASILFCTQVATALCVLLLAAAPLGAGGLLVMVAGAVGARLFWSGVVTLRAPIWRAAYPARIRARLTGTFFSVHSVVMALTALAVSSLLDWNRSLYPAIFTAAAAIGVSGAVVFRRLRIPATAAVSDEATPSLDDAAPGAWRLLRHDRAFARYLFWLSAAHIGNLMLMGPLIVIMTDRLHLAQRPQVLVTSVIPLILLPFAVPMWGRLFDGGRVLRFQMLNAAAFALAALAFLTGAVADQTMWLWIGAVLLGVAYAGGSVGWHLGHNYFSARGQTLEYMGVHVTLSGIRGLVAPLLGMTVYQAVERLAPGHGAWALVVPLLLCTIAVFGFARLAAVEPAPARYAVRGVSCGRREAARRASGMVGGAGRNRRRARCRPPRPRRRHPSRAHGRRIAAPRARVSRLLSVHGSLRQSGGPAPRRHGRGARVGPHTRPAAVHRVRGHPDAVRSLREVLLRRRGPRARAGGDDGTVHDRSGAGGLVVARRATADLLSRAAARSPAVGCPRATRRRHSGITTASRSRARSPASSTTESLARGLPPEQHPVIALADSPGSYPVAAENRDLQRYLRWSDEVRTQGEAFLAKSIARPLLAVHIRNGTDWQQACRIAAGRRQFMASPQCGLSDTAGAPMRTITQAICLPGPDEVVRSIRLAQERFGPFRSVFIGTDADDYRPQIEAALGDDIRVVRGGAPQLDLYVFGQADLFIGNCISSFTAFAVRERRVNGRRSMFFGLDTWTEDNSQRADFAQ